MTKRAFNSEMVLFWLAFIITVGSVFLISLLSVIGIGFVGTAYSGADTQELVSLLAEKGITETTFLTIFTVSRHWILIGPILIMMWVAVKIIEMYYEKRRSETL
jgi:hypothetical protein